MASTKRQDGETYEEYRLRRANLAIQEKVAKDGSLTIPARHIERRFLRSKDPGIKAYLAELQKEQQPAPSQAEKNKG